MSSSPLAALFVLGLPWVAQAAPLSRADAERIALERGAVLVQARAALDAAGARADAAGVYPFNPALGGEAGGRFGPGETTVDWGVRLGQTLEIAGQTGRRQDAARAERVAAEADYTTTRTALVAGVRLAYLEAVRARELLGVEQGQAALARELADATARRLAAGAATLLDRNIARAEVGRADARVRAAEGAYRVARAALADAIGLPATEAPEPSDALDLPAAAPRPSIAELLQDAHEHRVEVIALRAARSAAERQLSAAEVEAVPNVDVGGFLRREAGQETIIGGEVSVPLPIFDRNQGGIAEARSAGRRIDADTAALIRRIDHEVVEAAARLEAATATVDTLRTQVVETLDESAALVVKAVDAGKIAAAELVLVRQQSRDAARELLEAVVEANRASIQLDLAMGRLPLPKGD